MHAGLAERLPLRIAVIAATCFAAVVSVAAQDRATAPDPARAGTSAYAAQRFPGFLEPMERPDGLAIVPPPPAAGSAAQAADLAVYRAMQPLRDSARWRLAAADANVKFPHAASTFVCALGTPITESETPRLYTLLQRVLVDAGQSTATAKQRYQRPRPFLVEDDPICVPQDAKALRTSGSYPSGHAAAGWAWALLLADLAPDRREPLLERGYEFGISRVVCNVHWASDVEAGRAIGAATVARLRNDAEFTAELAAARSELAKIRSRPAVVAPQCAAEAQALGMTALR